MVEAVSKAKQAELPLNNSPKFVIGATGNTFTDGTSATKFSLDERVVIRIKRVEEKEQEQVNAVNTIAPKAQNDAIYDLKGRRIQKPTNGIYIKGGKKVVVK